MKFSFRILHWIIYKFYRLIVSMERSELVMSVMRNCSVQKYTEPVTMHNLFMRDMIGTKFKNTFLSHGQQIKIISNMQYVNIFKIVLWIICRLAYAAAQIKYWKWKNNNKKINKLNWPRYGSDVWWQMHNAVCVFNV